MQVGEGKLYEPNDIHAEMEIPKELLIEDYNDPINAIVQSTYNLTYQSITNLLNSCNQEQY